MGNMTKIVMGIVAIVVAFILMPIILTADTDMITNSQVDSGLAANTGVGVTTAPVTLTRALHNDDLTLVTAISSNLTSGDAGDQTADSWVLGTLQLTVGNLTANQTGRALTVTYDYGALDTYTGMEPLAYVAPTLVFVGLLFGGGLLTFTGFKGTRTRRKSGR